MNRASFLTVVLVPSAGHGLPAGTAAAQSPSIHQHSFGDAKEWARVFDDLVLLVDVFHHIDNLERYFQKLRASLKPGGRIAIMDFLMDSPDGPPKSARIALDPVKAELKTAGYGPAPGSHPTMRPLEPAPPFA